MRQVYLDNAATTPLHPQVKQAIQGAMAEYANPSSLHSLGAGVEKLLSQARAEVAGLLKVNAANLVFTSGGTEANNMAIKGALARSGRKGRLVTSSIEHPSVMEVYRRLESEGWDVVRIPVDDGGQVQLEALEQALAQPTALVSIMAVNNETGVIQPLEKAMELIRARQPRALVHVDAVQAPGKVEFRLADLGVDLASVSAHKIHGPKGIGALYLRNRDLINPVLDGGGQEGGLRSGTENVLGIIGFGEAARLAKDGFAQNLAHVAGLRSRFVDGMEGLSGQIVSPEDGVPHILAVSFPGFRGEVLLQALSAHNVFVSTGAACSGKKGNLSHVAEALGLDDESRLGLIRFSFSSMNTEEEVVYALTKMEEVLAELAFVRGRRSR